jgi:hypothetical protein
MTVTVVAANTILRAALPQVGWSVHVPSTSGGIGAAHAVLVARQASIAIAGPVRRIGVPPELVRHYAGGRSIRASAFALTVRAASMMAAPRPDDTSAPVR